MDPASKMTVEDDGQFKKNMLSNMVIPTPNQSAKSCFVRKWYKIEGFQ
jgi:hypothetical protein